jgi:hypothetical protein
MRYHADYFNSGDGVLDTFKCMLHFDTKLDSLYEQFYTDKQFTMTISKKNQKGNIIEMTTVNGHDSTFTNNVGYSKLNYFYNSIDEIDSSITQRWDTLQNVWKNREKSVCSYKKISVNVANNIFNKYQSLPQITPEWKNSTLHLNIPEGVTVTTLEQLDLQGRVISKSNVANLNSSIVFSPHSRRGCNVSLVRLKLDRGEFVCKLNHVK